MFINISNHPSVKWLQDQISSAKALAISIGGKQEIVYIPFPAVDPHATLKEISALSENVLTTIDEIGAKLYLKGGLKVQSDY